MTTTAPSDREALVLAIAAARHDSWDTLAKKTQDIMLDDVRKYLQILEKLGVRFVPMHVTRNMVTAFIARGQLVASVNLPRSLEDQLQPSYAALLNNSPYAPEKELPNVQ